jgi:hypothetical protein
LTPGSDIAYGAVGGGASVIACSRYSRRPKLRREIESYPIPGRGAALSYQTTS